MHIRGDYRLVCDSCGTKIWRSEARKRWDGLMVCVADFETRNIADFTPKMPKNEGRGVRDARPEGADTFILLSTNSDNFKKNKLWGDEGNAIWGGAGDPEIWGDS